MQLPHHFAIHTLGADTFEDRIDAAEASVLMWIPIKTMVDAADRGIVLQTRMVYTPFKISVGAVRYPKW